MSSQSCHELAQLQGAGPQGAGLAAPRSKAQGLYEPAS